MSRPTPVTPLEVEGQDTKLNKVQNQVAALKNVMLENVERVMERGERLDRLGESADELQQEAGQFKSRAKSARRQMWWQKCRMQIMVFVILLIIALVIFLAVCYSGGNNCTGSKHKPPVP